MSLDKIGLMVSDQGSGRYGGSKRVLMIAIISLRFDTAHNERPAIKQLLFRAAAAVAAAAYLNSVLFHQGSIHTEASSVKEIDRIYVYILVWVYYISLSVIAKKECFKSHLFKCDIIGFLFFSRPGVILDLSLQKPHLSHFSCGWEQLASEMLEILCYVLVNRFLNFLLKPALLPLTSEKADLFSVDCHLVRCVNPLCTLSQ